MHCHPFTDRVECRAGPGGGVERIKPEVDDNDRVRFLGALLDELIQHFRRTHVRHVTVDYANIGRAKSTINCQIGEVTGIIVAAAKAVEASVEKA